jgi:competence protein ComEC
MKRPLLLVGLLYVGGIIAAEYFRLSSTVLLSLVGVLVLLAFSWERRRAAALCAAIFFAGAANLALQQGPISPNDLRNILASENQIATVRGILLETPVAHLHEAKDRITWTTQSKLEISSIRKNKDQWQPAIGKIVISTSGQLTNLFAGQTVEVDGVIGLPPRAVAEGLFDYQAYLARLGYYFELRSNDRDWQILASPSPPLADRFRSWGKYALSLGLSTEDESLRLEWALTLGWKPALTEEVSEPFIRAATYHIFAVDGLRMAIIFGIFFGLLRAFSVPRAIIGVILIPLIWFYVALTGWPASAIRATVMLTIVIFGWVLRRPGELINSLFAAALIILLWQPQQLFQAGFQLSFFVVLCIILTVPVLHEWGARMVAPDPLLPRALHRRWHPVVRVPARYVWDILITSFAAWIGSLPLVAYYFNIVTPVSTPANLIAVPLCALVLISNLTSLLLAGWFQSAAVIFNHAGWFLMECIRLSSDWFANWPKAYAYVRAPGFLGSGLYYAILIAAVTGWLFKPAFRRTKFATLGLLLACWGAQFWIESTMIRLTILPVSGATAIFCDPPGTKNDLLIDCGRDYSVNAVVKPFLRAQGVNRLAGFVVTHGEARTMGGASLLSEVLPIAHIYASSAPSRSPEYRRFMDSCRGRPGRLMILNRDDMVASWSVVHPDAKHYFSQGDDNAIALVANLPGGRVLALSELGTAGQAEFLKRDSALRADIVIAALPNRGEPISDELLDAVQPRLIIVTDSEQPVQQRASAKLKARLAKRNIPVLYTRREGAITMEFKGKHWQLRTMEGRRLDDRALGQNPSAGPHLSDAHPFTE